MNKKSIKKEEEMKKAFTLLIAVCFVFAFALLAFAEPPMTSTDDPTFTVFAAGPPIISATGTYDPTITSVAAKIVDQQTGEQNEPTEAYIGEMAGMANKKIALMASSMTMVKPMAKTGDAAYAADLAGSQQNRIA